MLKYTTIVVICLIPLQTMASSRTKALELLNKYGETLDKYQSYIIKSNSLVNKDQSFSGKSELYPKHISGQYDTNYTYEIRYDGERLKTLRSRWGDLYWQKMDVSKSDHHYSSWLWDSKNTYGYGHVDGNEANKKKLYLHQNKLPWGHTKNYLYQSKLSRVYHGGSLMGYLYGDDERVDKILRTANEISVRDEIENIGGSDCYVIEADTKRGRYFLWIDPNHGYNIAKAMVQRRENDKYYKIAVEKDCKVDFLVENIRFEKVDDVWVPVEADTKLDTKFSYGDYGKIEKHHKITEVIFNPDHDALGSFLTDDIRNGTLVHIVGIDHIRYTWQDGKLIPNVDKCVMAQIDEEAEKLLEEKINPIYEPYAIMKESNGAGLKRKSESLTPPMGLTVSELMAKYQASQNRLRSFIAGGESTLEIAGKSGEMTLIKKTVSEFQYDGSRVNHRVRSWNDEISLCKDRYESFIWDGKSFIEYQQNSDPDKSRVSVSRYDSDKNKKIAKEYNGAVLMGICCGDYERIDLILGKARFISLQGKTETIGGSECYVIEANTKRGKYKVWIDPDHGYNIARIEVQRNKRDLIHYMESLKTKMSFSLKNVRFEKIDDAWVPMEADIQQTEDNGNKITRWHHKRVEFVLNPDHNTLESFVPDDIPDGTMVKLTGDSKKYEWRKGRPVALAEPRRLRRILPSQKDDTCVWRAHD